MRTLAIVIVAIIVLVIVGLGTLLGSSWLLIGIAFVVGLCVGLDWGKHNAEMHWLDAEICWLDREASLLRQLSEQGLLEPASEPEYDETLKDHRQRKRDVGGGSRSARLG